MKWIDFRSDTVTWPTEAMREAMASAEVGDDVYQDDPTVIELENLAAQISGKEAALFVPSGTMGNQLAIFTHVRRGDEVITADDNHIVAHEAGAAAIIAGAQLRCVESDRGVLNLSQVERTIRTGNDIHEPKTGLISIENAYSSGHVLPLAYMEAVYSLAKAYSIPVHLDGARLFNAATHLGVEASELCHFTDSVMFCLSKGLCAPVGSILAGSSEFIEIARRKRKILGGGMRQAGILAAAGIIALKTMRKRLHEDHETARYLAARLKEIDSITLLDQPSINMVFFAIRNQAVDPGLIADQFKAQGILVNPPHQGIMRAVTHYYIKNEHINKMIDVLKTLVS